MTISIAIDMGDGERIPGVRSSGTVADRMISRNATQ
jgi:hypothetical protein